MKVVNVTTIPGYKLQVTFDDGVAGIIDLKDFIETGIFSSLKDEKLFSKAYTTGYSIAWNEELEIDAVTIYAEITNKFFLEKVEAGLDDIKAGRVSALNDAKQAFLTKMF